MAHLRSNLTIRVPVTALKHLPPSTSNALQASALFVKGKATIDGVDRHFHLQITASGLSKLGADAEAELSLGAGRTRPPGVADLDGGGRPARLRVKSGQLDLAVRVPWRHLADASQGDHDVAVVGPEHRLEVLDVRNLLEELDRNVWEAMDKFTDHVALMFSAGEAFQILGRGGEVTIPVPAGASAEDIALYFDHARRRDPLGSTHHDAGTLAMGTDPAASVTNEFGRVHDTTNCYVASPALFPTTGSPNPMLLGVALARRAADLLAENVLSRTEVIAAEPGFELLFDGTEVSLNRWRKVGPAGQGFVLLNGELVAYGASDFAILYYAKEAFDDFTLRLQFRIFDGLRHNSGVFLRFRHPQEPVSAALRARAVADGAPIDGNRAWTAVYSGFEVQIDDMARGDVSKDFYGRRPEPDGLWKNRTGAIYKIPAGDFIAHLNRHDDVWQQYKPGPTLVPGPWFEYEIRVKGDRYTVTLQNLASEAKERTTVYENTDKERGVATLAGRPAGYIGVQSYPGQTVAFRNIRIKQG